MTYKAIEIDLGNNNWRYVTGIEVRNDLRNDLRCSIYPSDNITSERLSECEAIYPNMLFRIREVN